MKDPADTVRVYLDSVAWFMRPRNTDWRYVRFDLPVLPKFDKRIEIVSQTSSRVVLSENLRYLAGNATRRAGLAPRATHRVKLDSRELTRSQCDVVFSHRGFPVNAAPVPVIWQDTIIEPEMTAHYYPHADMRMDTQIKGSLFSRCAIVHVSTEAEVARLGALFPEIADRFFCTPFFVPAALAADPEVLAKHVSPGRIGILFVGDQARRKGLDLLLEAFQRLPAPVRARAGLTIVSRLTDGAIAIPEARGIEFHAGLPHGEVIAMMRTAHILCVPSRFESYGLVFPEAMSQGTVPVAPNWEVQRELLDNGNAGCLVRPGDASDLRLKLERLIEDNVYRAGLAEAALRRFGERYAPGRVAARFHEMFQRARMRVVV